MPEMPLTLRLIGLRVTKLKDLRAEAAQKNSGIKRVCLILLFDTAPVDVTIHKFFEPAHNPHPQKRKQAEVEYPLENEPSLTPDGFEETMPGFHEHDEADHASLDALHGDDDFDRDGTMFVQGSSSFAMHLTTSMRNVEFTGSKSRPPNSAPSSSNPPALGPLPTKPVSAAGQRSSIEVSNTAIRRTDNLKRRRSTSQPRTTKANELVEAQTCPICSKLLQVDNQAFNAHIDFCLSKEAIRDAQIAASASPSLKRPSSIKPLSTSKRKKRDIKKR
ncbi:uncharacterized protein FIBRA_01099 [Fibroporia radiculosa]|uniref:UBZ4-type domain-containing protein n=1 Tax=Fibroporia radiculosa TaxID=599839 RepID=J4GJB0_9APHY|nr:uncharacterized protein FIBRA_01099 [Fibroporia radiculosa]CCL99085.1 predicted protein [Fibroporia radiculosa]